jgi:uracil-DNA glycosylase
MTIRRITEADRQAAREHAELRQVFDELCAKYRPSHELTREEIANQSPVLETLQIDPHRRTLHR